MVVLIMYGWVNLPFLEQINRDINVCCVQWSLYLKIKVYIDIHVTIYIRYAIGLLMLWRYWVYLTEG